MAEAFLWGLLAASSLVIGALVVRVHDPRDQSLGLIMGFGAGVLISAVSFELVEESVDVSGGLGATALGFFTGAIVFYLGDVMIGRLDKYRPAVAKAQSVSSASGLTIVLGAALDGIPESAVLGLTLLQTGDIGITMLVAVFISNFPESLAASSTLVKSGWSARNVLLLWCLIAFVSAVSSAAGYTLLDGASNDAYAFVLAFAGGAILAMLSTSMIPEAYEKAGPAVGLFTTFGFAVAYGINWLDAR